MLDTEVMVVGLGLKLLLVGLGQCHCSVGPSDLGKIINLERWRRETREKCKPGQGKGYIGRTGKSAISSEKAR